MLSTWLSQATRAMSLPQRTPNAPRRDRGNQQRDQHVVAGEQDAEKTPLHFVATDQFDGVETLQQVAGAAEIADRASAIGRPLPEMPLDAGVIGAEPGVAERGEREDGEARYDSGAPLVLCRSGREQRAERDRPIRGLTRR